MYSKSDERDVYRESCKYMIQAGDFAKSLYMTNHGYLHALRVHSICQWLGPVFSLSSFELSFLQASALLHDIGMAAGDRDSHNVKSAELVRELAQKNKLPFLPEEADIVATLCKWHRGEYNTLEEVMYQKETIRLGMLASILRLSDELDLDYRRSDFTTEESMEMIQISRAEQISYHESVQNIFGVRLKLERTCHYFEIFINSISESMLQVERLLKECLGSHLYFPVKISAINNSNKTFNSSIVSKNAIIYAYSNPHGILTAILTKMSLMEIGIESKIITSLDFDGSDKELWNSIESSSFDKITSVYFIDLHISDNNFTQLEKVVKNNSSCNFFMSGATLSTNSYLQSIRNLGVSLFLGDEHVLFCSDIITEKMKKWIKVTGELNLDGHVIRRSNNKEIYFMSLGFKYCILQCHNKKMNISKVIDKVLKSKYKFFLKKSNKFIKFLDKVELDYTNKNKVLVIEHNKNIYGRFIYDYISSLASKIRTFPYNNFEFEFNYFIYKQVSSTGATVRVLYMSYFKGENVLPIRCFCNSDKYSVGTDNTIWKSYKNVSEAEKDILSIVNDINGYYEKDA